MPRYYLGVDWGDQTHGGCARDEEGTIVWEGTVPHTVVGLSEWGRRLDEWRATGTELWAAIEKPEGRVVDFLLDLGVVVYPVNPKARARARDRFRMSASKSDRGDSRVLAAFLRTDHQELAPLHPSSEAAQELKLLTRDHARLVRQQTRVLNQLTGTLKEYYPRPVEVFGDWTTQIARDFLKAYPTPAALKKLRPAQWRRFAQKHRLGEARTATLWAQLTQPQLPVPDHVVRAKARLVLVLVEQLEVTHQAVAQYHTEVDRLFATLPAAAWMKTLPGGKSGMTLPTLWAELGDAPGRWTSWQHLQAQAGTVPVTVQSGKSCVVRFRFACNKHLRQAVRCLAFVSLKQSEWARAYYQQQRARGRHHNQALRALAAKWLKILFSMWTHQVPYNEQYHLANMAKQYLRATA